MRPPRIAIVSTYYHPVIGGCETHARQVAHYLSGHGFEPFVLTRRTPPDAPPHEIDRGVTIRRLPPAGPRDSLGKWLLAVPVFHALWRDRDRWDLVYCVDLRGLALACWAAARATRKPVVLQAETPGALAVWADRPAAGRGQTIRGRIARRCLRPLRRVYTSADAYTCITQAFVDEGRDAGIDSSRLHYIPHAVNERRFHPPTAAEREAARARLRLPGDRPLVMFLGRLGVEKGVLDLLAAWKQLAHPTALLAVVGPDMAGHPLDAAPQARAYVAREALLSSVRFPGAAEDPSWVLHAADVFVQPSHYEAFGISLIEAMATGLPIAASGVGGMREFLVDGENALVTGARDPARLASALARLLEDAALRAALGSHARRTVELRFTEHAVGVRYAQLFTALVETTAS